MGRNGSKVAMATLAMVMSIVVLMMAGYAWYTLSTNPEIKGLNFNVSGEQAILISKTNENNASYKVSESLTKELQGFDALVPVSTVDGENWFVCRYNAQGDVLQEPVKDNANNIVAPQFEYMLFPKGGNVKPFASESQGGKTKAGNGEENESQSSEAESTEIPEKDWKHSKNYYIYTDIFLKTTEEKVNVYLTVPRSDDYEQDTEEKNHYGSYVMSYSASQDKENPQITLLSGGSETAVRVGMKVLGTVTNGEKNSQLTIRDEKYGDNKFYIYEPNADQRSTLDKTSNDYRTDKYIAGFEAKNFYGKTEGAGTTSLSYQEVLAGDYYIPTYPIEIRNPLYKIDGNEVNDGTPSVFPVERLIVQRKSEWKTLNGGSDPATLVEGDNGSEQKEQEETGSSGSGLTKRQFDSRRIGSMGKFLTFSKISEIYKNKTSVIGENTDYSVYNLNNENNQSDRSGVKITTLEKDKPVKVRLYFWIEGQDVDCWNDISLTNFLVNLEFSGQTN